METVFWVVVVLLALWFLFRPRKPKARRRLPQSSPARQLRPARPVEPPPVPVASAISKRTMWKSVPEDVLRNECVSYTRINTFRTCPRKFELVYLYGCEDRSGRAAQVGSLVHEIIHLYTVQHEGMLAECLHNGDAVAELLGYFTLAKVTTQPTYTIVPSEVRPYLASFAVLNRGNRCRARSTEMECNVALGDYKLKCIIDRVDEGNTIIDYKTGNPNYVADEQLNVYAYALAAGTWSPWHLAFQFLKTGEVRGWDYTQQLHTATEQWMENGIRSIESSSEFPRRASRLCSYCGVREPCQRLP